MLTSSFSFRVKTALNQCRQLLENHYRDYQMFHDGCVCGRDDDEDGEMSDYDDELCFKLQEAELACRSMHDWFSVDGKFMDGNIQYQVGELFAFCMLYAGYCSPILEHTLKMLIKELGQMLPSDGKRPSASLYMTVDDHIDQALTKTLAN